MQFSKKQNEYIAKSNKRWGFKIGAVRSGKSYVDISCIIPMRLRKLKDESGLNVILGVSKETIERNVLQPMREVYTDSLIGTINSRNIAQVCGVPVYCLGAEKVSQVAKIQGTSIKYCYGDEIAKWNKEVFAMLQSRLDKPYSCFDGTCNPESPGHWLKEFIDRPDIDSYVQKYTIFDNPFLPKKFVDDLCKEYAGTVYYGRYIEGEWTLAEGLIYPMYNEAIQEPPISYDNEGKEIPAEKYVLSIDYGTQNAFSAGLWALYDNIWYRVKEYYYSGRDAGIQKTDEEYADDLDKFLEGIETQGKIRTIIDPSAASFITLLRKRGRYRVIPADNAVADGIRETATSLKSGRIKISPKCKNWYREVQGYVWDDKAGEDKPVKVADHCLTGGTLVMTKHGEIPICELVGTSGNVWSYNIDTGVAELKPYYDCRMTQEGAEIYEIETDDGRVIRCTGEHPILTRRGFVLAKYLNISDKIIDITDAISYQEFVNGAAMSSQQTNIQKQKPVAGVAETSSVGVKAIRKIGTADVYNMEVQDNHNFAINGGLIVHNCMDDCRYFVKTMRIVPKALRHRNMKVGGLA